MQDSEKKLIDEILQIIRRYPDFETPYSRADGDIVIPLNSTLKKNREAHKRFANAFSQMMKSDSNKRRKNKAWV
jgi:hypothetical protein